MAKTAKEKKADKTVIETALKRFKQAEDYNAENNKTGLEELRFANGEQWPEDIKKDRDTEKRPCLTMNRTQRFIKAVVNDIRQVRPAIKVRPVDSESDPETAEMLNGMIRAIEQSCNAEIAYDWATEYAVTMGRGYFRITCDYTDPETFDKDIIIKRIRNPFSVYLGPHKEPDGSDAKWGFVIEDMDREQFEAKYPKVESEWTAGSKEYDGWFTENTVRKAEYWELEEEILDLSLLEDGTTMWGKVEGAVDTRKSSKTTLVQRIMTGTEILEEKRYPWKYIPIVPVLGEEIDIEGKVILKGMTRDLMDPAKQYNYMRSAMVERIALAPKAPWVGPQGAFASPKWAQANTKNFAFLEWDREAVMKAGGNPPSRTAPPDLSPGLVQEVQIASEELKAVSGIYDPGLGDRSNEVSGTAINARKVQSDIANFHFVDNLARSMRHAGRIIVDMIPTIYDKEQVVRILKPNGDEEAVTVNAPGINEKTQKPYHFDLSVGRYDVAVDIGPSYATQRQEAVENMIKMIQAFPGAVEVMGDLVAKNMDWPDSDEIAKRLKLLLPPGIAADENPQIKAIMQQNEQVISQGKQYISMLEAEIQNLALKLESKDGELQVKAGELQRKYKEMAQNFVRDMTKLEIDSGVQLPGGAL